MQRARREFDADLEYNGSSTLETFAVLEGT
jgi:hypothetical protein